MSDLDPALRQALTTYAAHDRILYGTDFDGVLAPLVLDPSTSAPIDGSVQALREVAASDGATVAIVSGRDLATLRHLSGIAEDEPIVLIGSHGAQPSIPLDTGEVWDDAAADRLHTVVDALEQVAAQHPGTRVERKAAGAALHTRGMDDDVANEAIAAAEDAARQLVGVHIIAGKNVLEIGVLDTNKGAALRALADHVGSQVTCYLGDDRTDERAFEVLPASAGHVTIKVGAGDTVAAHRIHDSADVLAVIRHVASARDS
ncbi:trehalose-phosphatase [Allobranchiibius sp. GilTou73]|uniref:trehalose-phosphatase n=1 Tax=Allobranchiibius sp. GilTou73 TaxID=2904523 RepID=UPI001F4234D9|nr:trehalose-phosphatase [Allobranchiibius sp. GilTou73]UIJ36004.1 trehalose-phosphatase [Allobranchiibius sp. GilTou73]